MLRALPLIRCGPNAGSAARGSLRVDVFGVIFLVVSTARCDGLFGYMYGAGGCVIWTGLGMVVVDES